MIILYIICFMVAIQTSSSKTSSRVIEGYNVGYLPDCPDTKKEAIITSRSLRRLAFIIYYADNIFSNTGNLSAYNYYQMKSLSKHLDFTKKTVLYVNGYADSNYFMPSTAAAMCGIYKRLGYNALSLEYNAFNLLVYSRAVRFLRPVGKHTAEMFAQLMEYGLDPKMLEIVGLSLGAQTISFIAKNFQKITGMNISRVTSLDPTRLCFRNNGPEDRIDASDADFVEIIHTNIEGWGLAAPVGHVDFYINGGEFQQNDFDGLPCGSFCSHIKSYILWVVALLNPNLLIGMQCDSVQDARDHNCFDRKPFVTNVIGANVDKNKQGIFYVMTNNKFPYGMGRRGLKKKYKMIDTMVGSFNTPDVIKM